MQILTRRMMTLRKYNGEKLRKVFPIRFSFDFDDTLQRTAEIELEGISQDFAVHWLSDVYKNQQQLLYECCDERGILFIIKKSTELKNLVIHTFYLRGEKRFFHTFYPRSSKLNHSS